MADRWLTDYEKILAHMLRQNGYSYERIAEVVSTVAKDGHRPNRSTIYRAIKNMPGSSEDIPFEWHRSEEYGLPWEASHHLLEIWVKVNEGEAGFDIGSTYNEGLTVRQAKWCWRVHLAAPDLGYRDTWLTAQEFVYEERHHDLLGKPFDVDDLKAYLAYGEWRSEEHRKRYHKARNEGRIPARKTRASGSMTGGGSMRVRGQVSTNGKF